MNLRDLEFRRQRYLGKAAHERKIRPVFQRMQELHFFFTEHYVSMLALCFTEDYVSKRDRLNLAYHSIDNVVKKQCCAMCTVLQ